MPESSRHLFQHTAEPIVVKLGGSLLDLPDLMERLKALAEHLHPAPVLIIAGGGAAANLVRSLDRRFGLTPEQAHWTAIAAMSFNAILLARLNSKLCVVADRTAAESVWTSGRIAVLDAFAFLQSEEVDLDRETGVKTKVVPARCDSGPSHVSRHRVLPGGSMVSCATPPTGAEAVRPPKQARWRLNCGLLPACWEVTSDSIAAWIAAHWRAGELVIAKSCDPVSTCPRTLIANEMLDPFFNNVVQTAAVHWLNLRKSPLSLIPLRDNKPSSP